MKKKAVGIFLFSSYVVKLVCNVLADSCNVRVASAMVVHLVRQGRQNIFPTGGTD